MITDELRGLKVDENLYTALTLAIIGQQHLKSNNAASHAIGHILNDVWGLQATILEVDRTTTRSGIIDFFERGAIGGQLGLVYVIRGLDQLPKQLQAVILEVMRSKRAGTFHASELFTVVGLADRPLTPVLVQEFWFEQSFEGEQDRFPLCDSLNASQVNKFLTMKPKPSQVVIVPEIRRYIYDIVIHVRCHRCVSSGFPTRAIKDLEQLSQCLCLLFDRGFVIPTIVKLACRKLIPFKIVMINPALEPTLQYGSDAELVNELMKRMSGKSVLEDVLRKVAPPM